MIGQASIIASLYDRGWLFRTADFRARASFIMSRRLSHPIGWRAPGIFLIALSSTDLDEFEETFRRFLSLSLKRYLLQIGRRYPRYWKDIRRQFRGHFASATLVNVYSLHLFAPPFFPRFKQGIPLSPRRTLFPFLLFPREITRA